jgi:curved DNA-binding protein CbpA
MSSATTISGSDAPFVLKEPMAEAPTDPYTTLGLPRGADADAIKRAYFALVRAHPPEREPDVFKRIRAAYELLRDPAKRLETDMLLTQPLPELPRRRRAPKLDTALHREDVIAALRALSDLNRTDWRDQQRPVKL